MKVGVMIFIHRETPCPPMGLSFCTNLCYYETMRRACSNVPIVGNLQTISLNRGTSLKLKAQRLDVNDEPILTRAEEIYFTVKKRWTDKNPVFQKSLADMTFDEEGYYRFTIAPEDTENLAYGQYVWDFTAIEDNDTYRAKPAHGILVVGNSSGWIINETED